MKLFELWVLSKFFLEKLCVFKRLKIMALVSSALLKIDLIESLELIYEENLQLQQVMYRYISLPGKFYIVILENQVVVLKKKIFFRSFAFFIEDFCNLYLTMNPPTHLLLFESVHLERNRPSIFHSIFSFCFLSNQKFSRGEEFFWWTFFSWSFHIIRSQVLVFIKCCYWFLLLAALKKFKYINKTSAQFEKLMFHL